MGKETIKTRIVDWHIKDIEQDFYNNGFIKLLQNKYDIEYSDKPDFLIYGPFGRNHLKYDCVRIFYTGENIRPDYNIADYSMDFDYMDFYDRHLRMPQFVFDGTYKYSGKVIFLAIASIIV